MFQASMPCAIAQYGTPVARLSQRAATVKFRWPQITSEGRCRHSSYARRVEKAAGRMRGDQSPLRKTPTVSGHEAVLLARRGSFLTTSVYWYSGNWLTSERRKNVE